MRRVQMPHSVARLFAVLALQNCMWAANATAPDQHAVEQPAAIKIARVRTLTGNAAHLGRDEENGALMAIDEINERGIVLGSRRTKVDCL